MLKNYFKTALRNLLKNKGYSFINLFGLAIGMAVVLLIGLWVQYETSYDTFHAHRKNIGVVKKKNIFNNEKGVQQGIMLPLYDELKTNYPEVKYITRLDWSDGHSLLAGDKKLSKRGHFADGDFLKMFSFPLLKGNADNVLKDPYSIVLTESLAGALFGKIDPIGKTVKIDKGDLTVTGVFAKLPEHFHLDFHYLMSLPSAGIPKERMESWQWNQFYTYIKLKPGTDVNQLQNKFQAHVKKEIYPTLTQVGSTFLPFFQPLWINSQCIVMNP